MAQNTIIVGSTVADKEFSTIVAHEWLHLELMKSPSPILGKGKIPTVYESSKALKALKEKLIAQGPGLNVKDPTAEYFAANAERYQTVIELQYVQLVGQISTLCDEWDIHLQMIQSGMATDRVDELAMIAQHLEKRISLANAYAALYRHWGKHRDAFTENTKVYGDATVSLNLFLEGLVEKYFAHAEQNLTDSEMVKLGQFVPVRNLSQMLK